MIDASMRRYLHERASCLQGKDVGVVKFNSRHVPVTFRHGEISDGENPQTKYKDIPMERGVALATILGERTDVDDRGRDFDVKEQALMPFEADC